MTDLCTSVCQFVEPVIPHDVIANFVAVVANTPTKHMIRLSCRILHEQISTAVDSDLLLHAAYDGHTEIVEMVLSCKELSNWKHPNEDFAKSIGLSSALTTNPLDYVVVKCPVELVVDWFSRGWLSDRAAIVAMDAKRPDVVQALIKRDNNFPYYDAWIAAHHSRSLEMLRIVCRSPMFDRRYLVDVIPTLKLLQLVYAAVRTDNIPLLVWCNEQGAGIHHGHADKIKYQSIELIHFMIRKNPVAFVRPEWISRMETLGRPDIDEIRELVASYENEGGAYYIEL